MIFVKPVIIISLSVLIASVSITSIYAQSQSDIPAWVKNNAVWWGEDKISDSEFIGALQYLINNGNLKVASSSDDITELEKELQSMKELKDKYQQGMIDLKSENDDLKSKIKYLQTLMEVEPLEDQIQLYELSVQELKQQAISWNYDDILRNEEYYIGKIIHVKGEISSADEREDGWTMLIVHTGQSEYGNWFEDLMYIWYDGSRLLDKDMIEAYIVVDEILVRETQFGDIYTPIGIAKHVTCTSC